MNKIIKIVVISMLFSLALVPARVDAMRGLIPSVGSMMVVGGLVVGGARLFV